MLREIQDEDIPGIKEKIKHIDSSLDKTSVPESFVAYRGVSLRNAGIDIKTAKPGDMFQDGGYGSTTLNQQVALNFAGGTERVRIRTERTMMQIRIPKGAKGAMINKVSGSTGESEFLLPRGQKYRVVKINNKTLEMTVEVVS